MSQSKLCSWYQVLWTLFNFVQLHMFIFVELCLILFNFVHLFQLWSTLFNFAQLCTNFVLVMINSRLWLICCIFYMIPPHLSACLLSCKADLSKWLPVARLARAVIREIISAADQFYLAWVAWHDLYSVLPTLVNILWICVILEQTHNLPRSCIKLNKFYCSC